MENLEGYVVGCPECHAEAYYRYGHIWSGKQRYICLVCGKQFTPTAGRKKWKKKPVCPVCGKPMYFYQRGHDYLRFRCSDYPACKQYLKTSISNLKPVNKKN